MGPAYNLSLDRPSYSRLDELLLDLARKLKVADGSFGPADVVERLKEEMDYLAKYNIDTYFPKSFKLLATWVPITAKGFVSETHDNIKADIDKANAAEEKRCARYHFDSKRPPADWLSREMKTFLPAIEDLNNKPEGLLSAIDLLIYLGEKSYTKMDIWDDIPGPKNPGPRDGDAPVDQLLVGLLRRARNQVRGFVARDEKAQVKESVDIWQNMISIPTSRCRVH